MKRVLVIALAVAVVMVGALPADGAFIGFFGKVQHYKRGDPIHVYAGAFFPRYLCKKKIKFRLTDSTGEKFRMRSLETEAEGILSSRQGETYVGDVPDEAAFGPAKLRGRQKCGPILGKASDTKRIYILRPTGAPEIVTASAPDALVGDSTIFRLNVDMPKWTQTWLTVTVEYEVLPDVWIEVETVTRTALVVEGGNIRVPWRVRLDSPAPAGRYRMHAVFERTEFEGGIQDEAVDEFTVGRRVTGADAPLDGSIDSSGRLVVGDTGDDVLAVYDSNDNRVDSWGDGILDDPKDLDFGPDGKIYVADWGNKEITILSPEGDYLDTYAEGLPGQPLTSPFAGRGGPDGIAVDAAANRIYVADRGVGRVYVFPLNSDSNDPLEIEPAEFDTPQDVAVAADGTLYVADETAEAVFHVSPAGALLGVLDTYNGPARSVSIAPDGRIYVVAGTEFLEQVVHQVHVYEPDGTPFATYGGEALTDSSGVIAAGVAGDVYVTEQTVGTIFRFRVP